MRCPNPKCVNGIYSYIIVDPKSGCMSWSEYILCPECHGGTAYCCDEAGANLKAKDPGDKS